MTIPPRNFAFELASQLRITPRRPTSLRLWSRAGSERATCPGVARENLGVIWLIDCDLLQSVVCCCFCCCWLLAVGCWLLVAAAAAAARCCYTAGGSWLLLLLPLLPLLPPPRLLLVSCCFLLLRIFQPLPFVHLRRLRFSLQKAITVPLLPQALVHQTALCPHGAA